MKKRIPAGDGEAPEDDAFGLRAESVLAAACIPQKRPRGFTKFDNGVLYDPNLTPTEKIVYAVIRSYSYDRGKTARASLTMIAKRVPCSSVTVYRATRELKKCGLLGIQASSGSRNTYQLLASNVENTPFTDATGDIARLQRQLDHRSRGTPSADVTHTRYSKSDHKDLATGDDADVFNKEPRCDPVGSFRHVSSAVQKLKASLKIAEKAASPGGTGIEETASFEMLVGFGFDEAAADELRHNEPERVKAWIRHAEMQGSKIRNPQGFVRRMLERNTAPPAATDGSTRRSNAAKSYRIDEKTMAENHSPEAEAANQRARDNLKNKGILRDHVRREQATVHQ